MVYTARQRAANSLCTARCYDADMVVTARQCNANSLCIAVRYAAPMVCVCVLQGDCLHTASALSDVELPYDIIQLYAAPCGELAMKLSYHINMQTK